MDVNLEAVYYNFYAENYFNSNSDKWSFRFGFKALYHGTTFHVNPIYS